MAGRRGAVLRTRRRPCRVGRLTTGTATGPESDRRPAGAGSIGAAGAGSTGRRWHRIKVRPSGGADGMGGMGGGMGRMMGDAAIWQHEVAAGPRQAKAALAAGQAFGERRGRRRRDLAHAKVRQIGTKTFYFKNGRWVDSSVKPDEDAKAEKIVQFSDGYFRLARDAEGRIQPVPQPERAGHREAGREGLSHRPRTQGCGALIAL